MKSKKTQMIYHVHAVVIPCDCATCGRDNHGAILHLDHHQNCERYQPEQEIRELLQSLINGIESWSNDEYGVHKDCWDAYVKACSVCDQWSKLNG